jgi:hypothetical protein
MWCTDSECDEQAVTIRHAGTQPLVPNREMLRNKLYSANQSRKIMLAEDYLNSYTDFNENISL